MLMPQLLRQRTLQPMLLIALIFAGTLYAQPLSYQQVDNGSSPNKKYEFLFGTAQEPAEDIVALNFKVTYSGTLVSSDYDQTDSWMNADDECTASMDDNGGDVDVHLSRPVNDPISGDGGIGYLEFNSTGGVTMVENLDIRGQGAIQIVSIKYAPKFYPIPASDWLNIETNLELGEASIYDFGGKEVWKGLPRNGGLSVADLRPGMYLLKLETEAGTATKKIAIRR